MTNHAPSLPDPSTLFDAAFVGSAITIAPQTDDHASFITALASACAPMAGLLPPFMLEQQSAMQEAAYRHAFPAAMQRIALHRDRPVGRIIVDWTPDDHSLGVDLAVLPDARTSGAGLAMLRTWLKASDALGKPARLSVRRDNVAVRIYARLGFHATGEDALDSPMISMMRMHK
jgi:GNAT superfamily N-acetyltransferase